MNFVLMIFGFLILLAGSLHSQEIKANVIVNTDQLRTETIYEVSSMADDVMNYINNTKFLDIEWEGEPIEVEISIILSGGSNNKFNARLLVISKRAIDGPDGVAGGSVALKMLENSWNFEYARGANLVYNTHRYERFSSMLDFYMLLVIGFDLDTYGELDGSVAFDKAKQIFSNGATSNIEGFKTFSSPGEYSKYNLISELTDMRFYDLRKLFFAYYVDGLDLMYKERERALGNIAEIMNDISEFKNNKLSGGSILLQVFTDAKSRELASLFNKYPERKVFNSLMNIDPSNSMMYQDARDGKFK